MNNQDPGQVRTALQQAMDDLLEGRSPGPLTGLRLVELAGVKRHRLTHDNADLNRQFQQRARELNRNKPEVEGLRSQLAIERERNARLVAEREELRGRVQNYANALLTISEERDELISQLQDLPNVIPILKDQHSS